jgi:hypothetical protein
MRAPLFATLLVVSLAAAGPAAPGFGTAAAKEPEPVGACVGTVADRPDASTVVSIQGTRTTSEGAFKEPALLVSFAPDGSVEWIQNSTANGKWWAYDVDPLPSGNLLYATTHNRHSDVGEFDPETGEYVWVEHFGGAPDSATNPLVGDAHDADLFGDELVLVDKGEGHERVLAYNLTTDRVIWEWRFEDHPEDFPKSGGGPPGDWTHVNDVDRVSESLYMVSVRNFDQVAFVDRSTDEVTLTLGEDDNYDILDEQHNPDYLRGPDGEHTVLVADSLNDRVVEYAYDETTDTWDRVWSVGGFDEPRDADRLANGNTLVTDRRGHRVVEITPEGRAVWEVYTPYEPYDTERNAPGSNGPTMREHGTAGQFALSNDAAFTTEEIARCAGDLFAFAADDSGLLDSTQTFFRADNASSDVGGQPTDSSGADSESGSGSVSDSESGSGSGPDARDSSGVAVAVAAVLGFVALLGVLGYRRYR